MELTQQAMASMSKRLQSTASKKIVFYPPLTDLCVSVNQPVAQSEV